MALPSIVRIKIVVCKIGLMARMNVRHTISLYRNLVSIANSSDINFVKGLEFSEDIYTLKERYNII
jgi:hypothetical protein